MIQKLAITAFALSMSAAFAADQPSTSTNSAQPSTSMKAPKASSSMAGDSQVKQVQQALKDKGQDPGPVDGKMGPKTQAALSGFQQAQGLSGSGQLDPQTLAALGVSGSQSASAASPGTTSSNQPSASANQSSSSSDTPTPGSMPATSSNQPATSSDSTSSSTNSGSANQSSTKQ